MKERARNVIETVKKDLFDLSLKIHAHPEVAYQEVTACRILKDYLAKQDFSIEEKVGGIETSFRASRGRKGGGPTIAFMAEYDALPGIGHGCGHNLIATGAVGAALGVAEVLKNSELDGQIEVIGTPAEEYTEGKAGKVLLLEAGAFNDVDVCLMFHPWTQTLAAKNDLCFIVMDVAFKGKTAHAAADPWNGRNALDGVVLSYTGISALRQQIKSESRIHMIITDGGKVVNVIPEQAKARIMLRSPDMEYLEELSWKVVRCVEGASMASETQVVTQKLSTIYNTKFNDALYRAVSENLSFFGMELKIPNRFSASSDFGNVSHRLPAFSFFMKTHREGTAWHSTEVNDGAISEEANGGMLMAAKVLSMSAIDLLARPDLMEEVKRNFEAGEPSPPGRETGPSEKR